MDDKENKKVEEVQEEETAQIVVNVEGDDPKKIKEKIRAYLSTNDFYGFFALNIGRYIKALKIARAGADEGIIKVKISNSLMIEGFKKEISLALLKGIYLAVAQITGALLSIILLIILIFTRPDCKGKIDMSEPREAAVQHPLITSAKNPFPTQFKFNNEDVGGQSFNGLSTPFATVTGEFELVLKGSYQYIGESKDRIIIVSDQQKILYSDDHFQTGPRELYHPLISANTASENRISSINIDKSGNIYLLSEKSIYLSQNRGDTWNKIYTHPKCDLIDILVGLDGYDALIVGKNCGTFKRYKSEFIFEMVNFNSGEPKSIECDGVKPSKMITMNNNILIASYLYPGIYKIIPDSEKCIFDEHGQIALSELDNGKSVPRLPYDLANFRGSIIAGGTRYVSYKSPEGNFEKLFSPPFYAVASKIAVDATGSFFAVGLSNNGKDQPVVYIFNSLDGQPYMSLNHKKDHNPPANCLLFSGPYLYYADDEGLYRAIY